MYWRREKKWKIEKVESQKGKKQGGRQETELDGVPGQVRSGQKVVWFSWAGPMRSE